MLFKQNLIQKLSTVESLSRNSPCENSVNAVNTTKNKKYDLFCEALTLFILISESLFARPVSRLAQFGIIMLKSQ